MYQGLPLLLADAVLPRHPGLLLLPTAHWLGHFAVQRAMFVIVFNDHPLLVLHVWQPGVVRFGGQSRRVHGVLRNDSRRSRVASARLRFERLQDVRLRETVPDREVGCL